MSESHSSEDGRCSEEPTVTFDESAVDLVLAVLGWQTDDEGNIRDEDGFPVLATDGTMVGADELGGIVRENCEPRPLRDDFVSVAEHAENRREGTEADA